MADNQKKITKENSTLSEPLLEVQNITKRFPGVLALDDVSLRFMPGEVHAVVGENGAGKSTLMKIASGAYVPDSGKIYLSGKKVSFSHPQEAQLRGISIIYQEFNLLPERTVAHNIFLGREPSRLGVLDIRQMNKQAGEISKGYWRGKNDFTYGSCQRSLSGRAAVGRNCESNFLQSQSADHG